jgi:hypothetical protein
MPVFLEALFTWLMAMIKVAETQYETCQNYQNVVNHIKMW